ncbi:sporulation protein, YlmC/YmxH family [Bhargavaea cecembensis]|uniref:Sporulation protein, YlmC/YmxH family n=1 Tax=Bhargavaea cecembensis TaxID=394098 RepID=A0A163F907_9BACL|nr:YlmC/YmxH family sporulation protein [Bhargavaea cecembensis]KZE38146.1 sporulation protein, YlmC/YmxH family [Bhargavaea cecembensis]
MLLSTMAEKELIQMEDGVRYGLLADTEMLFDPKSGRIFGFELKRRAGWLQGGRKSAGEAEYIPWEEIVLIGDDRILFRRTRPIHEGLFE